MRIAIDLTPLYGRKLTGVEMYAIDLYRSLQSTDYHIIPIFHCCNELDNNPNAFIISKRSRLWLENVSLSKAVRTINADVAIFPIFPPPVDLYYGCKTKIYQTIHDTVYFSYRDTQNIAAKYYYLPKQKYALKKMNGIITISETVKRKLGQYTDLPIYNLGENISAEYSNAMEKVDVSMLEKWGLKQDNYFISVSTIEPRKNFNYLLETIIPVLKEQNKKLVLVGRKGWGKNEHLQKLIEQAGDSLLFTDYVNIEELFSLYRYAYAFILLSKDEGFGRTPFEAVACGCKRIILSDIDIFHETFDGNALFVPLENELEARRLIQQNQIPNVSENFVIPFDVLSNRLKKVFFPSIIHSQNKDNSDMLI